VTIFGAALCGTRSSSASHVDADPEKDPDAVPTNRRPNAMLPPPRGAALPKQRPDHDHQNASARPIQARAQCIRAPRCAYWREPSCGSRTVSDFFAGLLAENDCPCGRRTMRPIAQSEGGIRSRVSLERGTDSTVPLGKPYRGFLSSPSVSFPAKLLKFCASRVSLTLRPPD
jgi:hypothetical protein